MVRRVALALSVLSTGALFGCQRSAVAASETADSGTPHAGRAARVDFAEVADAYQTGRLKIEVRNLTNTGDRNSAGGISYAHKATVVLTGDSALVHRPYYVLFSIRRLSGGDPATPRGAGDISTTFVENGVGDFFSSGGYRGSDEKWDAEAIELTPVGIFPVIPISGPASHE